MLVDAIKHLIEKAIKLAKHNDLQQALDLINQNKLDALRDLIQTGLNTHATDDSGQTVLHHVVKKRPQQLQVDQRNLVNELIAMGFPTNQPDKQQRLPVHMVTNAHDAKALLGSNGGVDPEDKDLWTPLFYATDKDNQALVNYFIAKNAKRYHQDRYHRNLVNIAKKGRKHTDFSRYVKNIVAISAELKANVAVFLHDLITECKAAADKTGKPLLFILGERHNEYRGYQVEKLILNIMNDIGINNLFFELDAKSVNILLSTQSSCSHMELDHARRSGFNIRGVDNARTNSINDDQSFEGMKRRNKQIKLEVEKNRQAGVLTVGAGHLDGLIVNSETRIDSEKYFIVPLHLALDSSDINNSTSKYIQMKKDGFDRKEAEKVIHQYNSVTIDLTSNIKPCKIK